MDTNFQAVYEISWNILVTWESHSGSNIGSFSSNKLYGRKQALSDGTVTDAISGNILKHFHASILTEYFSNADIPLCVPCASHDSRRIAAYADNAEFLRNLTMDSIISGCGMCDTHGFLITAKNQTPDDASPRRNKLTKGSLIEFSFALALPGKSYETSQMYARNGDSKDEGQMIYQISSRSGQYALGIRYFCAGIGQDTYKRRLVISNQDERRARHRSVLFAIRDMLLSPVFASTSTMLPLLSGLEGVIAIRRCVGRAPMYSALDGKYKEKLKKMASEDCEVFCFSTIEEFKDVLDTLVQNSEPVLPKYLNITDSHV